MSCGPKNRLGAKRDDFRDEVLRHVRGRIQAARNVTRIRRKANISSVNYMLGQIIDGCVM